MTEPVKHPLEPWEVSEDRTGGDLPNPDSDIFTAIGTKDGGMIALVNATPIDDPEVQGMPDRIVLAVNCHDDLLAACKAFVEAWEKSLQFEKTDMALRLAKAAIAKAEGRHQE